MKILTLILLFSVVGCSTYEKEAKYDQILFKEVPVEKMEIVKRVIHYEECSPFSISEDILTPRLLEDEFLDKADDYVGLSEVYIYQFTKMINPHFFPARKHCIRILGRPIKRRK